MRSFGARSEQVDPKYSIRSTRSEVLDPKYSIRSTRMFAGGNSIEVPYVRLLVN